MKQDKLEFEITLNAIRNTERAYKKEAREAAIAQGASCLSCKYTKTAVGARLHCTKKDKYVSQYNYCEYWKLPKVKDSEK